MKTPPRMEMPKSPREETTLSLEGLMMLDLRAWTAAKEAIERARVKAAAAPRRTPRAAP